MSTRRGLFTCQLIAALILFLVKAPVFAASAGSDNAVRNIVTGIISYTRWPSLNGPPVLCVFASSPYATAFSQNAASSPSYKTVIVQNEQDALTAQCNALYFGSETAELQQQITSLFQQKPLLTIAEQNSECIIGSAFCLRIQAERVTFSVNLDALSRSGVRVNPDVLMLARNNKHD